MKKVLFATTAIVLSAGAAAAQNVTITGTARVGALYVEDSGGLDGRDTQINTRLRFNITASKETDVGVTMGGRIRMQYDSNNNIAFGDLNTDEMGEDGQPITQSIERGAARLNAAYVFAEFAGLRVEVGNANTAFDTVALLYNSEMGFIGQTFGSYAEQSYYSYSTNPYGQGQVNRMGIFAAYSIAGANLKMSYITPDQRDSDATEELSLAADYVFGGFTLAAALALDAGSIEDNDVYFLGAEYAYNDLANVGLHINYTNPTGEDLIDVIDDDLEDETTITLYGNYKFGAITGRAYIAHNNNDFNENDLAYGAGADYDLGGATLAGHVESGFDENIRASLGVKFSF